MTPAIRQTVGEARPGGVTEVPVAVPERERTAADVLRAAARYIEEHGWTQGVMEDYGSGRVCVLGAVYAIARGDLAAAALAPLYRQHDSVADWNDTPGRTEAEVLAALRLAAAAADGSAS